MPVHSATWADWSSSSWPWLAKVRVLPSQGLTRGFAGQLEVLQLVALEGAVEAQQALQLGLGAQYRLVAAEEGQQFDRDIGALADRRLWSARCPRR